MPGTVFAERYRIVHRLGKGGMAEVYRAEDLRLGQTIALKFLLPSLLDEPRRLERFRDEARLARRVNHSAVCRIYDFGEYKRLPYVAMEYVEGEHLASLRRRVGRLSTERALDIALEICRGLGAIHEQGILHRDLKPANVMLDGQGRVRILDFGLAAMVDQVSKADVRSGTPAYMAPEQARGECVSVRSDLYSLGLVLRELWVGERLRTQNREDPTPIASQVEGIAPAIDRIVARCLAIDPERRPASAESVAASLQQAKAFEPGPKLVPVIAFDPPSLANDHREVIADLLESFGGHELWDAKGSLWLFERPWDAVSFAVALRDEIETAERPGTFRLAVEVTEVDLRSRRSGEPGSWSLTVEGDAAPLARALVDLARPGQTLLSELAYHLARRIGRTVEGGEGLSWLAHGHYRLPENDEPVEVFEVGMEGRSPLAAPASSEAGQPAIDSGMVTGWRPAPGASIPQRPNFRIERRAGEGGFGEVWLARHRKTGVRRVFKFCFDASHLRGLRREITLFRLLKEELGDRDDIARLLDWDLDQAPFYIESEYTEGGDLAEWIEAQGGAGKLPLEQRLELVAQVADALAAAHSVGVLHKDVKPGNILITTDSEGRFKARLADFGVGLVTDTERLEAAGITIAGWTTLGRETNDDSASGTRLYLAPEVLEGRPPTVQADIYALGVVLYQLVVGHLGRAVAPGWRDAIDDPILVEDLAAALHGDPTARFQSAQELAIRLRSLDERRAAARQAARRRQEEERRQRMLEQAIRRRRAYRIGLALGLSLLAVMSALTGWALHEQRQEAAARRESERVTDFLVDLFDIADPFSSQGAEIVVPELSAVELLDRGVNRLESAFKDEPRIQARLLNKLGTVFVALGKRERARGLMERGLEIRLGIFGPDHLQVAESLGALGYLGSLNGDLESESQLRKALEIRRRDLPTDHLDLTESLRHLAMSLAKQDSYPEAEALFREALAMRLRLLGDEHPLVAASLNDLSRVLQAQGSYAEAESFDRQALAMYRRVLGDEHPDVAVSLNNLATVLRNQGSYTEAEALYRESLAMRRRLLGDEHPRVAISLHNLAGMLRSLGSYTEAEALYREALAMNRRLLGDEHPDVAWSLNSLALVLKAQGSYAEAEVFYRESLAMSRRLLGDEHLRVAISLNNLGSVLHAQGFYLEAEPLLRQGLTMRGRLMGEDHPHLARNLKTLARLLIDLQQLDEAEQRIQKSLTIERAAFAPNHWRISETESIEAAIWIAKGRFTEAEPVLLASYANVAEIRGSNSHDTRAILGYLVNLYETWDKPVAAEKYRSLWLEAGGRPDLAEP